MCAVLQGHAAALPRALAPRASSNRLAASLAMLHFGSRACSWVVVALEPHSSAFLVYDCGGLSELTIRPVNLEALHLGTLSGDGGTALFLRGTLVGAAARWFRGSHGGDAFRLVMAETTAPWRQVFCASPWTAAGDREQFANAWRHWVEGQSPVEGMMHLPPLPNVPPVRATTAWSL